MDNVEIAPMLIQPYVENAIKHGLLHREDNKSVDVIFKRVENYLQVVVDDNGIGRDQSAILNERKNKSHQSFATKANEKRLEILNKGNTDKVSVQIIDKKDALGQALGTRVEILIPV